MVSWRRQGREAAGVVGEQVGRALGRALGRLHGKVANFQRQICGSDAAAESQKLADLLMANLHRWGSSGFLQLVN